MALVARVRQAREARGLNQTELADTHRILGWVFWWENLEKW